MLNSSEDSTMSLVGKPEISRFLAGALKSEGEAWTIQHLTELTGGWTSWRIDPRLIGSRRAVRGPKTWWPLAWSGPWRCVEHSSTGSTLELAEKEGQVVSILDSHGNPANSPIFQRSAERAAKGVIVMDNTRCISSHEDVLWRFGHYRALAIQIAEDGFRSAAELDDPTAHDPGVSLGPDGRLIWHGNGHHRTVIATRFALPSIPVVLKTTDRSWLTQRSAIASTASVLQRAKDHAQVPEVADLSTAQTWLTMVDRTTEFPLNRPDPDGLNTIIERSGTQQLQGHLDAAVRTWEAAPKVQLPPYAQILRARLDVDRNDLDTATRRCRSVTSAWNGHIAARQLLATIARQRKDIHEALRQLEIILSEDPLDPWTLRQVLEIGTKRKDSVLAQEALDALAIETFDAEHISSTQRRIDRLK